MFLHSKARDMSVYENYNVIAFKSCIQKFTVYLKFFAHQTDYFTLLFLKNTKIDYKPSLTVHGQSSQSAEF